MAKRRQNVWDLVKRAAGPAAALLVIAFFGGYALAGPNGIMAWGDYKRQLDQRQAELDKLKSTPLPRFDEAMVQNVVIPAHQADIARYERAAQDSTDPEVKAFIQRTLPVLKQHLKSAQTLPLQIGRAHV